QAEDGIRDGHVTGVQTCALPISRARREAREEREPDLDPLRRALREGRVRRTPRREPRGGLPAHDGPLLVRQAAPRTGTTGRLSRSEERRVGKEWRSRWWAEE